AVICSGYGTHAPWTSHTSPPEHAGSHSAGWGATNRHAPAVSVGVTISGARAVLTQPPICDPYRPATSWLGLARNSEDRSRSSHRPPGSASGWSGSASGGPPLAPPHPRRAALITMARRMARYYRPYALTRGGCDDRAHARRVRR